jgi:glycosyltransferase involved in cell wall biosynthesis
MHSKSVIPSISIITICFNNLQELQDTCRSVDAQTVLPGEHWIIDGSTTDDIRSFLESSAQPFYRKWINEKDDGIADAFNKGVIRAAGPILNMLNSGDTFFDEKVLERVTAAFSEDTSLQWLHAKYELIRGGRPVIIGKPFEKNKLYRGMRSLCHQTMFLRKDLHTRYGLYDTSLTISMDYDFVCRIADEKFRFLPQTLVKMAPLGISGSQYLKSLQQGKAVYTRHFGPSIKVNLWQTRLKILHNLLSSRFGKWLFKIKTMLKLENM